VAQIKPRRAFFANHVLRYMLGRRGGRPCHLRWNLCCTLPRTKPAKIPKLPSYHRNGEAEVCSTCTVTALLTSTFKGHVKLLLAHYVKSSLTRDRCVLHRYGPLEQSVSSGKFQRLLCLPLMPCKTRGVAD